MKSMCGERISVAEVASDGIVGDRLVHVRESSGRVATSRFRPGLLGLAGTLTADGEPLIDGIPWSTPEALARVRAVTEPGAELVRFDGEDVGQRFDVLPLTVLTESVAILEWLEERARLIGSLIGLNDCGGHPYTHGSCPPGICRLSSVGQSDSLVMNRSSVRFR